MTNDWKTPIINRSGQVRWIMKGFVRLAIRRGAGTGICARCQYGQVIERQNGQRTTFCHNFYPERIVPADVVSCNEYVDAKQPTRHDLEKIAWVIRHDRSGAIKGFEPPPKKRDPGDGS